jgi:hypothetical protein
MKNNIQTIFLCLFLPAVLHGQILERSVLSTTGSLSNSGDVYIAATVGEPVIGTVQSETLVLTQGFQQPLLEEPNSFVLLDHQKTWFTLFPNPAEEEVSLRLEAMPSLSMALEIMDMLGRLHIQQPVPLNGQEVTVRINISTLPAGLYFLQLGDTESGQTLGKTAFIKN